MSNSAPPVVATFIAKIKQMHSTTVEVREILPTGKSAAFVALVDCSGPHDGIYVLKVDAIPTGRESEEARHRQALKDGAFSGKLPAIVLSEQIDDHYCLLIKIAGESRITWRPLVNSLGLFQSAYARFAEIAWTPSLFAFGEQQTVDAIVREATGYKLIEGQRGRIRKHISEFLGNDFLRSSQFVHHEELLPNPFAFATGSLIAANERSLDERILPNPFISPEGQKAFPTIRPLLGPVHGDCHAHNLFVRVRQDASVIDAQLIDFATYQSKSLYFFDHAYLEIATIVRQMDQMGEVRWLKFVTSLAKDTSTHLLEPDERGWLEDILSVRKKIFEQATSLYQNRMDDIQLQFLLAHVAAGLAFLHKVPRRGPGSGGLSASQYRQCFIWSAVFLRELLKRVGHSIEELEPDGTRLLIPVLGKATLHVNPIVTEAEWKKVKYFDDEGFNILIVPSSEKLDQDILTLDWSLIIDFRTEALDDGQFQSLPRVFRQSWPGQQPPDMKLLTRGGLWYFANGRSDLSGVPPAASSVEWRRRYRRSLDDFLTRIAETISPPDVRIFVLCDGFAADQLRFVVESIDSAFRSALAPVVLATKTGQFPKLDTAPIISTDLDTAIQVLLGARAPKRKESEIALLPRRGGSTVSLQAVPSDLLEKVGRDLTLVFRNRGQTFPTGRMFGVDFRRGMPIEWAELAQGLDVPRASFGAYRKQIEDALNASGNHTVNLLHEPSAGGTTLSRRLAWEFMETFPVVGLDQISADTSSYLREIFQFCSLPVLVLMEASVVTESERESLLQQLREDNTRAVFLWVSRIYGQRTATDVLSGKLDDQEAALFRDVYLEQVTDKRRASDLEQLATLAELKEQRNPFFFGLTAFGEKFLGVDRLVHGVIDNATEQERMLLIDLALVSLYSNDGFPLHEFDELCALLNDGQRPVADDSLFVLRTGTHVRVSHALLAEKALALLARNTHEWRTDLPMFSTALLGHLRRLEHAVSDRVQTVIQTLFITRDIESALQADTDLHAGGLSMQRRFSPLINELGSVTQARTILRSVANQWPMEPHYAAHLVRHLLYEEPKEVDEAIAIALRAKDMPRAIDDAAVIHVVGMAYRVRMEQRLREAASEGQRLDEIEELNRADFQQAIDYFARATGAKPNNEHGLVATIQTVAELLRQSVAIAKSKDLSDFLKPPARRWYMEALALAEDTIEVLRDRPRTSKRAQRTIAVWNHVYGKIDKVINDLRVLATRYEDMSIRRALCSAIVARSKHRWGTINQGDLMTIAQMMERNITQQGVRDADVRRWFAAYRRMNTFDISFAIERLIDWHNLNPKAVDPVYYLYVLYFLRWLTAASPREGLATQVTEWLKRCQANRPFGQRTWSFDWLERHGTSYRIVHFHDLDFDPTSIIRAGKHPERKKLDLRLARLTGIMRDYRGPQQAQLDFGQSVMARITPLDRLSKEDEGRQVSAIVSFSYDCIVGWDAVLELTKPA